MPVAKRVTSLLCNVSLDPATTLLHLFFLLLFIYMDIYLQCFILFVVVFCPFYCIYFFRGAIFPRTPRSPRTMAAAEVSLIASHHRGAASTLYSEMNSNYLYYKMLFFRF